MEGWTIERTAIDKDTVGTEGKNKTQRTVTYLRETFDFTGAVESESVSKVESVRVGML